MIHSVTLLVSVIALTSCAQVEVRNMNMPIRGFDRTAAKETKVASDNFKSVKARYNKEWAYNRQLMDRPPQLCLAMSGGGMRSAAFNIGVLKGLYDADVLDRVDVLSSVSGGAYAMSWFYLQQASTDAQPEELFNDNGRFQQYLSNNSNLAYDDPDSILRWLNYVWEFGKWAPSWFANIFANGLFDWRANLNPLRLTYENGIERVFHASPVSSNPEQDGFINKAGSWSTSAVEPDKKITFPGLRKFIEQRKLPFFVINATVAIDDDPEHYGAEFANSIYEFTPLWHGSDIFGEYFTKEFPFSVSRAVAISGAAKDASITPGALREVTSAMTNTDLGYFIENPNSQNKESMRTWKRMLPLPFYLAIPNYKDANGTDIYLTDGGHSDNLATFSLVRRMCGEIIVVDAEHDPKFELQGLRRLMKRLFSEMGVGFDFQDLDLLKPFDQARPVRTGTIGSFPVQYSGARRENRNIDVQYLKLSIDDTRLDQYSPTVQNYYKKYGKSGSKNAGKNNQFPQQSTGDINYNSGQFLAYRDLGTDMVRIYLEPKLRASREPGLRASAAERK